MLNKIAVGLVGITSIFIMGMSIWYTRLLTATWCSTTSPACYELLSKLISALALNSHITIGIIGLCLGTLVVIVIAQGKLSFKGGGFEGSISD